MFNLKLHYNVIIIVLHYVKGKGQDWKIITSLDITEGMIDVESEWEEISALDDVTK